MARASGGRLVLPAIGRRTRATTFGFARSVSVKKQLDRTAQSQALSVAGEGRCCGGAAGDAQLAISLLEMLGHGSRAALQASGDGGVGLSFVDHFEDLKLPVGQRADP